MKGGKARLKGALYLKKRQNILGMARTRGFVYYSVFDIIIST
jgi:hypothetical protein